MYNTKFILENGDEIYPGYLDKEQRGKLRASYKNTREYMRCGCKPAAALFYRISEDCKIYPEHNNYVHDRQCCRYKDKSGNRQTAYEVHEEDGEVTAYLSFDPKSFSMTAASGIEKEQDNDVPEEADETDLEEITVEGEKNDSEELADEKKEPKLTLKDLIRSINADSFTEKILNNRMVKSKEDFSKFVYYRMKKVRINKMRRALGDLTLEKDGVKFYYLPLSEIKREVVNGIEKCYVKTVAPDGKIFSNFIFPKTLDKAVKEYRKMYGCEPDQNTMIAGFQYLKKSKGTKGYRVLGRVHLFQVSNIGIYCRSRTEKYCFDQLQQITIQDPDIRFWIPPEDEDTGAIIEIKGVQKKILLLFRKRKNERVVFDSSIYVPYVAEEGTTLSNEKIRSLMNNAI